MRDGETARPRTARPPDRKRGHGENETFRQLLASGAARVDRLGHPPMRQVTTVRGPVGAQDLGITLTHEHVLSNARSWFTPTESAGIDPDDFAGRPVDETILWELRNDPFGNIDNCALDSVDVSIEEVRLFAAFGGQTIVDATTFGVGRDLAGLRRVSEATGVHIVAGTGLYLEGSQPAHLKALDVESLAQVIIDDLTEGVDGIRPGFIGEVGVGKDFTQAERASLRAACAAQRETGLAMQIHLPAWFRLAHEVLDIVEAEGVDPAVVVLCHMGPSGDDWEYQTSLAGRGAWIQYDMIGMEVFYADQQVQCPSDDENARWLARLAEAGFVDRMLISHDIFLKSLQRRHGGPGYGHILQFFVPRLERHGFDESTIRRLMITNPANMLAVVPLDQRASAI